MATDLTWVHAIIWPVLNALLGILLIEYCWAMTKPIRDIDEARDSKYPAFRRYDAVKWSRWKFYPGAVTLMLPRLFFISFNLFLAWIFTLIITLGSDMEQHPLIGCRRKIINCLYWVHV